MEIWFAQKYAGVKVRYNYLGLFFAIMLLTACDPFNYQSHIPGSILSHSQDICLGGVGSIKARSNGQYKTLDRSVYNDEFGRTYTCTNIYVFCNDNYTVLSYYSCDDKWWENFEK